MKFLAPLLLALGLATTAAAGPFDDLSDADRGALRDEIRSYLLENPEVLMEAISVLEDRQAEAKTQAEQQAVAANHDEIFSDGVSHVKGNPDGDVTIVEFFDYQCTYCKRAHPEVTELLESDGKIRLIQKEFPILGPMSETAARNAIAVLLNDGGDVYQDFSDSVMAHDGPLNQAVLDKYAREAGADLDAMHARAGSDEVTAVIARNRALGHALQISGTPTFVFGDHMVRGYVPLSDMRDMVDDLRAEM